MSEYTLSFDGWAPDLQNVAMEVSGTAGSVPCADCLNVYYQDASFRCLPGPNPFAPSLGVQALNLFSGYDNISANNYIYAATANGISIYQNGVWASVPVEPAVTVTLTGLSLGLSTGGTGGIGAQKTLVGRGMKITTGNVTSTGGDVFSGTLTAGQNGFNGPLVQLGYIQSNPNMGLLSPTTLYAGGTVFGIYTTQTTTSNTKVVIAGTVPQSLFNKLRIPSLSVNLATSAVSSFQQAGGQSIWTWNGAVGFVYGNSYGVRLSL